MRSMSTTGLRLTEIMNRQGWNQTRLASEVGTTQGAISKIIKGETTNSRLIPKIAARLNVSLPWLLGETDDPSIEVLDQALQPTDWEWIKLLHALGNVEREAILQLARTLANASHCDSAWGPRTDGSLSTLQNAAKNFRGAK